MYLEKRTVIGFRTLIFDISTDLEETVNISGHL
jgi:hypothetical protein